VQGSTASVPILMGVWFRYAFQAVATTAVLLPRYGTRLLRTEHPRYQLLRGTLLLASSTLAFFSLRYMPLAEFTSVVLIAPLVAVRWGRLPVWYLLLGAAYYLFAWGLWARRRLGLAVHAERLRPSRAARFFAGIQMTVTAVALFPVLPRWVTVGAATVAMLPTLGLFVRDWFIVIGRLPAIETPPQRW